MTAPLLEARHLVKRYGRGARSVVAVNGVDFTLHRGEILGIVGESGSGKSTLGRILLKLTAPTSGEVWLDGSRVDRLSERAFRPYRRTIQAVFQQPQAAFDPRWTVRRSIEEFHLLRGEPRAGAGATIEALAREVRLDPALLDRLPGQVSGGQLQRLSIARALAARPALLVLDEPTSALDVSLRAQIVRLLLALRAEEQLTYVLISHDMEVIRAMATRVAVMRHGVWVEEGPAAQVLGAPAHPYTKKLLAAADAGMDLIRPGRGR
ncbi:ABC transporter ATP-binding protein [Phytohabitans kaempferiae]|uniref:ABC transporter ATP-binding protein n=1 Tax=Phytohabitans kaempferiae TaxID=1620943 RepID=A0ABV6MA68_9ACTN